MSVAPIQSESAATSSVVGRAASAADAPAGSVAAAIEPGRDGQTKVDWDKQTRLAGLHRFAIAITLLNVIGHGFLGFETSWAHPLVALATAYSLDMLLEWVDARANDRPLRFLAEGVPGFVNFLLSAHISALAVSMLLYPNQRLWPIALATALAIGSKHIFRVQVAGRARHVFNPSNFGIAITLMVFPWVGIAPPYQFTENVAGSWDWLIPGIIICSGTFINFRFTSRLVLLGSWLAGFACQAVIRTLWLDASLLPSLAPMTGLAFLLFTFYMVTDPPTTPSRPSRQVAFGLGVAAAYGLLMAFHVVFGLFFSLLIVCSIRGLYIWGKGALPLGSGTAEAPQGAVAVQRAT